MLIFNRLRAVFDEWLGKTYAIQMPLEPESSASAVAKLFVLDESKDLNASFFRIGPSLHIFKGFVYEDLEDAHVVFGPHLRSRWRNVDAHKVYRFTRTASLDLWLCEEQHASNYTVVQETEVSAVAYESQPEAVLEHIVVLLDTVVHEQALDIQRPDSGFTDVAAHVEAVIAALSTPRNEK